MVGVPGRSKGCNTCRRRKVKCDEGKPLCNRCRKAGLECEGYSKSAIYVHRTADGVLKRTPMEDTIPDQSRFKAVTKEIELTHVWRRRIEEYFLERFLAVDHSHQSPSPGSYVLEAISGITRDSLLESAIEALCLSRVGRLTGDDRLLRQGFQSYSTALQKLDIAVSNEMTITNDSTCAAAKIMNLHEFYEPSYNSGEAVYVHTIGIEKIIAKRGPEEFKTRPMKTLLKASRYNSMITMIKGRSSYSPLADPQWKFVLSDGIDGIEYALHDIGFDIASLMHSLDNYQRSREDFYFCENEIVVEELVQQCYCIHRSLKDWYRSFTIQCPSPIYWHNDQTRYHMEDIPSLQFSHVIIAHIITDYWALNIILGRIVGTLSKLIKVSDFLQDSVLLSDFNELAASYCNNTQLLYALKIIASVDYCSRQEAGLAGADHSFALDVSLNLFKTLSGAYPRKLEAKTAEILNGLASNGLQFCASLTHPTRSTAWDRLG